GPGGRGPGRDRGKDGRGRRPRAPPGGTGGGGRPVAGEGPRPHLPADEQAGLASIPDHDAVGQLTGGGEVTELAPGPIGALPVQGRVHLRCPGPPGQGPRRAPRPRKSEEVTPAARPARPPPG